MNSIFWIIVIYSVNVNSVTGVPTTIAFKTKYACEQVGKQLPLLIDYKCIKVETDKQASREE